MVGEIQFAMLVRRWVWILVCECVIFAVWHGILVASCTVAFCSGFRDEPMVGEWDGPSWCIVWALPQYIFLVGHRTLIYSNVVYIYIHTYYLYSLVVSTTFKQTWLYSWKSSNETSDFPARRVDSGACCQNEFTN